MSWDSRPLLLERYLSIARRVTTAALGPASLAPNVYTRRISYETPQTKWIAGLPFGTRGGMAFSYRFPTDGEYSIKIKLQRRYDRIIGIDRYVGGSDVEDKPKRERIEIALDGKPVALFAVGYGPDHPRAPGCAVRSISSDEWHPGRRAD